MTSPYDKLYSDTVLKEAVMRAMDSLCSRAPETFEEQHSCMRVDGLNVLEDSSVAITKEGQKFVLRKVTKDNYELHKIDIAGGGCSREYEVESPDMIVPPIFVPDRFSGHPILTSNKTIIDPNTVGVASCSPDQDCYQTVTPDQKPVVGAKVAMTCLDNGYQIEQTTNENGQATMQDHFNYSAVVGCADREIRAVADGKISSYLWPDRKNIPTYFCKDSAGYYNTHIGTCVHPNMPLVMTPYVPNDISLHEEAYPLVNFGFLLTRTGDPLVIEIVHNKIPDNTVLHLSFKSVADSYKEIWSYDVELDSISESYTARIEMPSDALKSGHYFVYGSVITTFSQAYPIAAHVASLEIVEKTNVGYCQIDTTSIVSDESKRVNLIRIGNNDQLKIGKDAITTICDAEPYASYCDAGFIQSYSIVSGSDTPLKVKDDLLKDYLADESCPRGGLYLLPKILQTREDFFDGPQGESNPTLNTITYQYVFDVAYCISQLSLPKDVCDVIVQGQAYMIFHEVGHAMRLADVGNCINGDVECLSANQVHLYDPLSAQVSTTRHKPSNELSYLSRDFDAIRDCRFFQGLFGWTLSCDPSVVALDDCNKNATWRQDVSLRQYPERYDFPNTDCVPGYIFSLNVFAAGGDVMQYGTVDVFNELYDNWRFHEQSERKFRPYNPVHTKAICEHLVEITGETSGSCHEF